MAEALIGRRSIVAFVAVLAVAFATGSFLDYQISLAVFDTKDLIGNLVAGFGQQPACIAASVGGVTLVRSSGCKQGVARVGIVALGVVGTGAAVMLAVGESYYNLGSVVAPVVALGLNVAANALFWHATQKTAEADLLRFAALVLVVCLFQAAIINGLIKDLWARPRMRMIQTTEGAYFQPWWEIASGQRDQIMVAQGVAMEEFRSFPSGHTASAACALLLCMLPLVCPSLDGKSGLLFWVGVAVTAFVAFYRIVMGAHFLTDVTAGATITFVSILVGLRLFYSASNKPQKA